MSVARPGPLADWEGRRVEEWRRSWGLPQLLVYAAATSTNDLARELAAGGAPAGATVLADHQTRGRGQRGRSWVAPAGQAVLLSMVLRPGAGAADTVPSVLPVRVGLVVARALEELTGLAVGLKWPNDVVVNGCKVGGILCEGVMTGGGFHGVAGIGLNVLQQPEDFPPGLDPPAASLRMLGAAQAERALVAGAIARAVASLGDDAARLLDEAELREYAGRDILRGRRVTVDGVPAGTAEGLAPDGALLVAGAGGTIHIRSGTVRPDSRLQGATS
ncbi:MAG TPA: biotin--[acetyl-CoA-carboxylase] ligase [Longimicrobiales bacterium]